MNKEFVPYELAVKLKELGFDEPCFLVYHKKKLVGITNHEASGFQLPTIVNSRLGNITICAPLYQQAFRWFRDKKLSDMCICRYQSRYDGGIYYYYHITHDFGVEEIKHFKEGFISYEEAELACLNKLIEIVQGGQK